MAEPKKTGEPKTYGEAVEMGIVVDGERIPLKGVADVSMRRDITKFTILGLSVPVELDGLLVWVKIDASRGISPMLARAIAADFRRAADELEPAV